MRTPIIFSADQIRTWGVQTQGKNGLWTQCRPECWPGFNLLKRISAAYMVFTGKADVLIWLNQ